MADAPPHFFIFPISAPGHTIPALHLAKLFATRGARATLLLAGTEPSPSTAAAVSHLQQDGHPISMQLLHFPAEAGIEPGRDTLDNTKTREESLRIMNSLPLLEPTFHDLILNLGPDCVVTDMFLPWTADVAEKLGIPRLLFPGTSNFAYSAAYTVRKFSPQSALTSDTDPFALPGFPDEIKMTRAQIPDSPIHREMWQRVDESLAKTYGFVMNSYYELEEKYIKHLESTLETKSWQVGPLFLYKNNNNTEKEKEGIFVEWLDSKKPNTVLYICFGSVSTQPPPQMVEIAAALEELTVPFIWVVKSTEVVPEGLEERVGERGLVIRGWAPQTFILGHEAVGGFVTHCGWNSVLEGLTSGVPMVTWPMFAEQFFNEKLVTVVLRVGTGVGVERWGAWEEKEVVGRERVKEAVGRVMGDGEEAEGMRERAGMAAAAAKMAVAVGGSSYIELDRLFDEVKMKRDNK